MNKFAVSLALVALFVGVVAANSNKLGHRRHHHHDDVEEELEEHRPILRHPHRENRHGLRHGGHHQGLGHKLRGAKGVGAGVAAGVRSESELDAGVHHGTRAGSHKSAEAQKGFLAGSKKAVQAGHQHHDSNDTEGHHRKSAHNKNKLIVAEKDVGFEDDKGFRHHDEHSDSAHIGASDSKFVGGKSSGKLVSDKALEHETDAGLHAERENSAGFAAGVGAGAIGESDF